MWPYYLSMAALAIGAAMGLYGLLNPAWSARIVRLQPDPAKPGGAAEFRATYGGLFLAVHGVAAYFLSAAMAVLGEAPSAEAVAAASVLVTPTCALPAALWIGTAVGRALAMALDKARTGYNAGSVVFEIVMGAAIAAPLYAP